jgi:phosphoribosyl-ATP pyrophosphohydrolase
MTKAFALPGRKTVDLRNKATNDPSLESRLPAAFSGRDSSPPLSPTETAQCASASELDRLHASLDKVTPESHPRTAKLLLSGTRKSAQKVIEEAGEVALEAAEGHSPGVIRESADLLYHLVVLWRRAGVEPADVWNEMRRRASAYGIAEKLPKSSAGDVSTSDANH